MGCAASTETERTSHQTQPTGSSITTFAHSVVQNTTLLVNSAFAPHTSEQQPQAQIVQPAENRPAQPIQAWTYAGDQTVSPTIAPNPIVQDSSPPAVRASEVASSMPMPAGGDASGAPGAAPPSPPQPANDEPASEQHQPPVKACEPKEESKEKGPGNADSGENSNADEDDGGGADEVNEEDADADANEDAASEVSSPDQSLYIPDHQHPLQYFTQRYHGNFRCNMCNKSGTGPAFACDACKFDAHIECFRDALEVPESGNIAAHSHLLLFSPQRYEGEFDCNICEKGGSGPCFACDECGFDVHMDCFKNGISELQSTKSESANSSPEEDATSQASEPETAEDSPPEPTPAPVASSSNTPPNGLPTVGVVMNHMHPLKYYDQRYDGSFSCNICRNNGSGAAYACNQCSYDVHIDCFVRINQQMIADMPASIRKQVPGFAGFTNYIFSNKDRAPPAANVRAPPLSANGIATVGSGGGSGSHGSGIDRAKLGKSFSSPFHAHPVNYLECTWSSSLMSSAHCFDCAICGNQGTGAVLWCGPCNFGAHPACFFVDAFESPQSSTTSKASVAGLELGTFHQPSPSQHAHKMQYLSWERPWNCGQCRAMGNGKYYYCFECNYTVHDRCFKAYDPNSKEKLNPETRDLLLRARSTRWSSVHHHPLTYMPDQPPHISLQGRYVCRACATDGAGASWSCAICALNEVPYCLHLHCFKDDGPGSDVHLADLLEQLTTQAVVPDPIAIESFVRKALLPPQTGADGQTLTPALLAASIAAFPYLKTGFTHPPLGVKAAPIWNRTNAQDAAHQYDVLYPIAKAFACDTDENGMQPLSDSLKVAVFFDLYKLQDWSVNDRMNNDMNVVVWRKILEAHASGNGFDDLKADGILVTPIDSMPGRDCAFITHRWNGVQGIGGMSISLFQTFTYHMAIASGYKPEVVEGDSMHPLYVWLDYLSVPQTSWNSAHNFSADELAVRQRLNSKYIQFIGLEFGTIAKKSAFFINYVPLSFELNEDPATIRQGHKLKPVIDLLKSFGTLPSFYIQSKQSLTSTEQNWDPVDELEDWAIWQDRSYATRIWCVAEYSTVYLAGLGDRIKGAFQWYSVLLPIITANDPTVLSRFHAVRDSYYTSDCLERITKHAFGAWQDFNPQVQRREDPFRPMKMSAGQICQNFLSVEGLLMALAPAIATVKSDVPLVTDTMYRAILHSAWNEVVDAPPSALRSMRNWILRQGRCGLDLPAILDDINPQSGDLKADFVRAFQTDGVFDRYISYLGQYLRQGFNSMLWIDALLVWSAILQLPQQPSDPHAMIDIDSILKPMPVETIPKGYRNAKYAYTWLNRTLDISAQLITGYFMPSYSSNGWSGMVALTEPIPFQFSGATAKPITTSFVKYLTPSHDPHDNPLSSFSKLNSPFASSTSSSSSSSVSSGYQLLYKVRSSYTSSAKGVNRTHVMLDGAVAVPRSALHLPDRFEVSSSNAHECVDLNGSKLGLLLFTSIYPLERELPKGLQCQSEGIPQPMWKISNHATEFKTNVIVAHSNVK